MNAIILAAGEGTRLRPFTDSMPKVMLPVANKPILQYVINALVATGISDITLVVGYQKERIMDYFQDGKKIDANITYVTQDKQLGTGHALLQAQKKFTDEFLVLPGDNIIDEQLVRSIIDQEPPSLLSVRHPEPSKYGVITTEDNRLTSIHEKPVEEISNIISTGIYKFSKTILPFLTKTINEGYPELTHFIQQLLSQNTTITTINGSGIWQDIVYPWDLLKVNEIILQNNTAGKAGVIEPGVTIKGPVSIGKNSIIRSGSYLIGPVIIGEGCEIGPYTCIFPSTTIGDNVTIGPFTELRNSIIMNDVSIRSRCSIKQTIIGEGCTLETNILATSGNAYIRLEENNQFHKLTNIGCFIGENTRIQTGVIINPGVSIGSHTHINPQKTIINNVGNNSIVV